MEVDFIIVGFGIAGMSMAFQLEKEGKSVFIIDGNETKASIVAAGLYNPVILKRFTLAWGAEEQMHYAENFYSELSQYLGIETTRSLSVFRKFNNPQEQNKWFSRLDNPQLKKYLSPKLTNTISSGIASEFKFGEVKLTGKVLISDIFNAYSMLLKKSNRFLSEEFDYKQLDLSNSSVNYNGIKSKHIIFCEGHKMLQNPYFKELPLVCNRGGYLIIKSDDLNLQVAVKSYYFIIPLGDNKYKFGATYGHRFTKNHDVLAKQELIERLDDLINVSYTIVDFIVGVRPTVIDRRPLLGQHKQLKQLYVMNGMGTRGVLLAPTASFHQKELMINDVSLPNEMDINRFD